MMVSLSALSSYAQDLYVGGSFQLKHYSNSEISQFAISPEIGYNFSDKWAAGLVLSYRHDDNESYTSEIYYVAPYARYTFFKKGILSLFVDGEFLYSKQWNRRDTNDYIYGYSETADGIRIGVKPGLMIKLADRFNFTSKIGFMGYSDYGTKSYEISLDTDNISFGFTYSFGK